MEEELIREWVAKQKRGLCMCVGYVWTGGRVGVDR